MERQNLSIHLLISLPRCLKLTFSFQWLENLFKSWRSNAGVSEEVEVNCAKLFWIIATRLTKNCIPPWENNIPWNSSDCCSAWCIWTKAVEILWRTFPCSLIKCLWFLRSNYGLIKTSSQTLPRSPLPLVNECPQSELCIFPTPQWWQLLALTLSHHPIPKRHEKFSQTFKGTVIYRWCNPAHLVTSCEIHFWHSPVGSNFRSSSIGLFLLLV